MAKVEKGVPTPVDNDVPIPMRRFSLVNTIKPGESFVFPREERPKIQSYASVLKKRYNKVYTIAVIDDKDCRIWRLK